MRQYVTNTSYQVLINEQRTMNIQPIRGLRQGDPFSPYLFILLGDVLSRQIEEGVRIKRLSGLILRSGFLKLHHLFFADESLFFLIGTMENARERKTILMKYCNASCQRINNAKLNLSLVGERPKIVARQLRTSFRSVDFMIRGNTWVFLQCGDDQIRKPWDTSRTR